MLNRRGVYMIEVRIGQKYLFFVEALLFHGTIGYYSFDWYANIYCGKVVSLVMTSNLKLGMLDHRLYCTVAGNVLRLLLESAPRTLRRILISWIWKHTGFQTKSINVLKDCTNNLYTKKQVIGLSTSISFYELIDSPRMPIIIFIWYKDYEQMSEM